MSLIQIYEATDYKAFLWLLFTMHKRVFKSYRGGGVLRLVSPPLLPFPQWGRLGMALHAPILNT